MDDKRRLPKVIKGHRSRKDSFYTFIFVLAALVCTGVGGYYFLQSRQEILAERKERLSVPSHEGVDDSDSLPQEVEAHPEVQIATQSVGASELAQIYAGKWDRLLKNPLCGVPGTQVAFVFYSERPLTEKLLRRLEKIPGPFSLAIEPDSQIYGDSVLLVRKKKGELFLFVPMEPSDMLHVGPSDQDSLLTVDMRSKVMGDKIDLWVEKMPAVVGVINRMGSAFTSNRESMEKLFTHLKRTGLIFLDGGTTSGVIGENLSREVLAFYLHRDFTFNMHDKKNMKRIEGALRAGRKVTIFVPLEGVPVKKIGAWISRQHKSGVRFVKATDLLCSGVFQKNRKEVLT